MQTTAPNGLHKWYKNFSLQKGQEIILNFPERQGEMGDRLNDLVELINAANEDPENYAFTDYDQIILASLAALDDQEHESVIPIAWASLGLQTGSYEVWEVPRVIAECQAVLAGKNENVVLLLKNIREITRNENAADFSHEFIAVCILDGQSLTNPLTWQGALVVALGLCVVYESLYALSEEEQDAVLGRTFYLATCADAPVRASLQAILFNTKTVFSLIPAFIRLLGILAESTEPVSGTKAQNLTIGTLWKQYLDSSNENWDDIPVLVDYSTRAADDNFDKERIFIALNLLRELKAGTLQPFNDGDVPREADIYRQDVFKLMFWFGLGESGVEILRDYFSDPSSRVSVENFIIRLKEACNLSDQDTVGNLLIFTSLARDLGARGADQELIVYNEATEKFEWT